MDPPSRVSASYTRVNAHTADRVPGSFVGKVVPPDARSLPRQRLLDQISEASTRRLVLMRAPAGWGKSTVLAQFARLPSERVAWYRPDVGDSSAEDFFACIARAIEHAVQEPPGPPWTCAADMLGWLDGRRDHLYLFIDDVHSIAGTEAHRELERLVTFAPDTLTIVLSLRPVAGHMFSQLCLDVDTAQLGPAELRFRYWETAHLFSDHFGRRLPSDELSEVLRATEGWAAGLRLFHLATSDKPAVERRRMVRSLPSQSALTREYLTQHLLRSVPPSLQRFLVDTVVLPTLSGELCADLSDHAHAHDQLSELEDLQIVERVQDGYRLPPMFRAHLENLLVRSVGEAEARSLFATAGRRLVRSGRTADAVRCFCRAHEWDEAASLTAADPSGLLSEAGPWIDTVPAGIVEDDPWLALVEARRRITVGDLKGSMAAYRGADRAFSDASLRPPVPPERRLVQSWLTPSEGGEVWSGQLRRAVTGQPSEVLGPLVRGRGFMDRLAWALACCVMGRFGAARRTLDALSASAEEMTPATLSAELCLAFCDALRGGSVPAPRIWFLEEQAALMDVPWLVDLARAMSSLADGGTSEQAEAIRERCSARDDRWGAGLAGLIGAFSAIRAQEPERAVDLALAGRRDFEAVGAHAMAVWCRACDAVATGLMGHDEAVRKASEAVGAAKDLGVPGAAALVARAGDGQSSRGSGDGGGEDGVARSWLGSRLNDEHLPSSAPPDAALRGPEIRLFGGFEIGLPDGPLDLKTVRRRARIALRILALNVGSVVHEESLCDVLWPDADLEGAKPRLQVVVSSLRQLLAPIGDGPTLEREGHGYRLAVPESVVVDIKAFTRLEQEAASFRRAGDLERAVGAWERALGLYGGDLLPEDGPAEWVVAERDRFRSDASAMAERCGAALLELGDAERAVSICEAGLGLDRFADGLWRVLTQAHESRNDGAATARTRQRYDEVLAELGVA